MKKLFTAALIFAAVSCFAGPGDSQWALRLGPMFPRVGSGLSADTGATFSVSYRLIKNDSYTLEIESLGSAFKANDGTDSGDFTTSNFNLVGLFSVPTSKFYGGASVGFGKASVSSGNVTVSGDTRAVYGPVAGYKINQNWFAEARYMFSDVPALRGTMILAGYRF